MSDAERVRLGHQMRGAAAGYEASGPIRARVDRRESALIVALFFEYARSHELSPAEAESLLAAPGSEGPRALQVLGLDDRPGVQPGRSADSRTTRPDAPRPRTPGR